MAVRDGDNLDNRVIETANRLRLIQVDFADESDQTRSEYIAEEVERALKMVLPEERDEFLKRLIARFPTWGTHVQPTAKEQEAKSDTAIDAAKLKDINFLVRSLSEIAPTLAGEQKESVIQSLQQAGLGLTTRQDYSDESVQKLKADLQLGEGPPIDAERLTELTGLLADFVFKLDPLVWNTWRELSARSSIRRPGNLKESIGQFIRQGANTTREQVSHELKSLQRLIAAIVTAIGRVGGQYAKRHLSKFAPSEISAIVRMGPKSVLVSQEVKCWRKYVELADALTEDAVETEIRKAIADYVESLMKGMGQ